MFRKSFIWFFRRYRISIKNNVIILYTEVQIEYYDNMFKLLSDNITTVFYKPVVNPFNSSPLKLLVIRAKCCKLVGIPQDKNKKNVYKFFIY